MNPGPVMRSTDSGKEAIFPPKDFSHRNVYVVQDPGKLTVIKMPMTQYQGFELSELDSIVDKDLSDIFVDLESGYMVLAKVCDGWYLQEKTYQ